jgi:DUF177 domain-containing protein
MNKQIKLKRPGMGIGDTREFSALFDVSPFDLYGRHHEVSGAEARVRVTRLSEGLHLDFEVVCDVATTCDRTLEPVNLALAFGESEFLPGSNDRELYVEDWEFDVARYTEEALLSEVPMQVFAPGTEPISSAGTDDEIDPRWRSLGDLFAAGF